MIERKPFAIALLITASVITFSTSLTRSTSAQKSTTTPEFISAEQLKNKLAQDVVTVIDVRNTEAYVSSAKIKGSIYIKLRRLFYRLSQSPLKDLPRDREVVTYCACPHDEASIRAAQIFMDAGFKRVRVLQGGWQNWLKANGQVEPRPKS